MGPESRRFKSSSPDQLKRSNMISDIIRQAKIIEAETGRRVKTIKLNRETMNEIKKDLDGVISWMDCSSKEKTMAGMKIEYCEGCKPMEFFT